MKNLTEVTKPNTSETKTKVNKTNPEKDLNKENEILQSKLKSLEESYKLKCVDYDKLLKAYRDAVLKIKATSEAVKTLTESYNLSLELLFSENGGEH